MIFQIALGIVAAYLIITIGIPILGWLFRIMIIAIFSKPAEHCEPEKPFCFHRKVGTTVETPDGYFEVPCLNCGFLLRQPKEPNKTVAPINIKPKEIVIKCSNKHESVLDENLNYCDQCGELLIKNIAS